VTRGVVGVHRCRLLRSYPPARSRRRGRLEQITQFDYDAIDREAFGEQPKEDSVTFADASAALALVLGWACESKGCVTDLKMVAARGLTLHYWLSPEQSNYNGMAEIASVCGCTRAALSAHLLKLKDGAGCLISCGKGFHTRATFANSQRAAVKSGSHSSLTRADRKDKRA